MKNWNNSIEKVKKRFDYKGMEIRIVEVKEYYMNSTEPITIKKVIAPNGGELPIRLQSKQTLKSIQAETVRILDGFAERGADVKEEMTKELHL